MIYDKAFGCETRFNCQYRQDDNDGLLVKLPCRVGDIIFYIAEDYRKEGFHIEKAIVDNISIEKHGVVINAADEDDYNIKFYPYSYNEFCFFDEDKAKEYLEQNREKLIAESKTFSEELEQFTKTLEMPQEMIDNWKKRVEDEMQKFIDNNIAKAVEEREDMQ